jgi:hypothetical protein
VIAEFRATLLYGAVASLGDDCDPSATGSEGPERSPIGGPSYEEVRKAARGQRKDYRLDREPIAQGGQAEVFRGVHKAAQVPIALKKLVAHNSSAVARMRREIDASRKFGSHPHVMSLRCALPCGNRTAWAGFIEISSRTTFFCSAAGGPLPTGDWGLGRRPIPPTTAAALRRIMTESPWGLGGIVLVILAGWEQSDGSEH